MLTETEIEGSFRLAMPTQRNTLSENVLKAIESLREEVIASTSRILQFNTVSGSPDEAGKKRQTEQIAACAAFLEGLAGKMGFRWLAKPGRWYCIEWPAASDAGIHPSRRPKLIGIPTHIDVVPVGDGWKYPAFSGEIAEGSIWGRGAQDDKGPLIASLYGMYALKLAGFTPPVTYRLIIGTQEEIGDWSDLREYLQQEGNPDFGFTPDADFPLIIGEKGMLNITLRSKWSPEPSAEESESASEELERLAGSAFASLKGGTRSNIVPDVAELHISAPANRREALCRELMTIATQFTVEHAPASATILPEDNGILVSFLGKAAHGSTPHKGHNAALDALKFAALRAGFPEGARKFAAFAVHAGRDYSGGNLGIDSTHDFIGPTTVNLGVVNLGPTEGSAILNIRPTLGMDRLEAARRVEDAAREFGEQAGIDIAVEYAREGHNAQYLDPEKAGPFLRGLQEGFETVMGRPAELRAIGGTTYAKAMPNCCAFGPIMTDDGEEELIHQVNERVGVEAQVRNTKIYALSLAFAGLNLAE